MFNGIKVIDADRDAVEAGKLRIACAAGGRGDPCTQ